MMTELNRGTYRQSGKPCAIPDIELDDFWRESKMAYEKIRSQAVAQYHARREP